MFRLLVILISALMIALVVLLGVIVAGFPVDRTEAAACRSGNVLEGVHDPERLKVIAACVTARGTVAIVQDHDDGDWHIGLIPDLSDMDLLGRANVTKAGGLLVVEVIPKDQPLVQRPRAGSRVAVTGAYVIDTPYGWREIHPAWDIQEASPSPLPQGLGEQLRSAARYAKKALVRLRAELRERLD